jgi:F0F1-type ATP synthase assembly protein I
MPKNIAVQIGKYYGLIFVIPISVLIGFGIGYALDVFLKTTFLKIIFLLLGAAAGIIEVIRELSQDDPAK